MFALLVKKKTVIEIDDLEPIDIDRPAPTYRGVPFTSVKPVRRVIWIWLLFGVIPLYAKEI